jgi:hypothetical protein
MARSPTQRRRASELLDGYSGSEPHVLVYRQWRNLGSSIAAALMRAGEAAKEDHVEEDGR